MMTVTRWEAQIVMLGYTAIFNNSKTPIMQAAIAAVRSARIRTADGGKDDASVLLELERCISFMVIRTAAANAMTIVLATVR